MSILDIKNITKVFAKRIPTDDILEQLGVLRSDYVEFKNRQLFKHLKGYIDNTYANSISQCIAPQSDNNQSRYFAGRASVLAELKSFFENLESK